MSTGCELQEIKEEVCKLGKKQSHEYVVQMSGDFLNSIKRLTGILT